MTLVGRGGGAALLVRQRFADGDEDGRRLARELELAVGDDLDGPFHVITMDVSLRSGVCRLDVVPKPEGTVADAAVVPDRGVAELRGDRDAS